MALNSPSCKLPPFLNTLNCARGFHASLQTRRRHFPSGHGARRYSPAGSDPPVADSVAPVARHQHIPRAQGETPWTLANSLRRRRRLMVRVLMMSGMMMIIMMILCVRRGVSVRRRGGVRRGVRVTVLCWSPQITASCSRRRPLIPMRGMCTPHVNFRRWSRWPWGE